MASAYSYLAATHQASPYVSLFKDVEGTMTEIDLSSVLSSAATSLRAAAWSPDGKILLLGQSTGSGSGLKTRALRLVEEDVFEELDLSNFEWPGNLSAAYTINGFAWHPSGDWVVMITSIGLFLWRFNKATNVFTLTSTTAIGSNTGNYSDAIWYSPTLLLGTSSTYSTVTQYTFNTGTEVFTAATAAATSMGNNFIDGDIDRGWIVVGGTSSPFLKMGTISGTTHSYVNPSTNPPQACNRVRMAGPYVVYCRTSSPFLHIYRKIGTGLYLAGQADAGSNAQDAALCKTDRTRIAIAHNSTSGTAGRIGLYRIDYDADSLTRIDTLGSANVAAQQVAWGPAIQADLSPAIYDIGLAHLLGDTVDRDNLKAMFVSGDYTFDAAHDDVSADIVPDEAGGSNWPVGGVVLTGVTFAPAGDGRTGLTFTFPSTALSDPGTIEVAAVVIYDATADVPILYMPFAEAVTLNQYDTITLNLLAGRILTFTPME